MQQADKDEALGEESLQDAIKRNPAQPDNGTSLQPHGEKLKRGPNAPEYNPNLEFVDVTTEDVRPHSLVETVQRERPLLDDQQTTPFHAADKTSGAEAGLQGGRRGGL